MTQANLMVHQPWLHALEHLLSSACAAQKQRPLFLLMGTPQAGKSALLRSEDQAIEQVIELPGPGQIMMTPSARFLELPGDWLTGTFITPIWVELIKCLKRSQQLSCVGGMLWVFDATTIEAQTAPDLAKRVHHALHFVSSAARTCIPIQVIVSKLDCIQGFVEFFDDISAEQQKLPWGFMVPNMSSEALMSDLPVRWQQLQQRLQERLLWLLQHSPHDERYHRLQEFPLQIQLLSQQLIKALQRVFSASIQKFCPLNGVYLTSTTQTQASIDHISAKTTTLLDPPNLPAVTHHRSNVTYFTQRLFNHTLPLLISSSSVTRVARKPSWWWLGNLCGLGMLVYGCMLIGYVQHDLAVFKQIHQRLLTLETVQQRSLARQLPKLSAWLDITKTLDTLRTPAWIRYMYQDIERLRSTSQAAYQQALRQQVQPACTQLLETVLNQTDITWDKRLQVYRAYLMWGHQLPLDPVWLEKTLLAWWQAQQPGLTQSLKPHLQQALRLSSPVALQPDVVQQQQQRLQTRSVHELIYWSIKAQHSDTLLTQADFQRHTHSTIPQACANPIPLIQQLHPDFVSSEHCVHAVRQQHLHDYRDTWLQRQRAIIPNQDTPSLVTWVRQSSEIQQRWQQLHDATQPMVEIDATQQAFNEQVADHFLPWRRGLRHWPECSRKLRQWHREEKRLQQHSESNRLAWVAVKAHHQWQRDDVLSQIEQSSQALPESMQTALQQLLRQVWQQRLQRAQRHIQSQWQQTIMSYYHPWIEDRYPLKKQAAQDISLDHFTAFFSPSGHLAAFIKTYLAPFYQQTPTHWQPLQRFKQGLTLSQDTMMQLVRSQLIQQMYFDHDQLQVHFKIKTGNPLSHLLPTIYRNGQALGAEFEVSWPEDHTSVLTLKTPTSNQLITQYGPWSWFKLLDTAQIHAQPNFTDHWISWSQPPNQPTFHMTTAKKVNPFVHDVFGSYQLPDQLFA